MVNKQTQKNISENWQTKKLGEVCDISIGKTPARGNEKFWDREKETNNIWLSIRDLSNTNKKEVFDSREYISNSGAKLCKKVKRGILLASFKLTLGRLAFAGIDLYTNEAIAALEIKNGKELNKEYLYYYLTFFDWHTETKGDVKVKGKTLNKTKLKEIKVFFPLLSEQTRIVKILDRSFAEMETAKKNAERNLRNAKELFESYLQEIFENGGDDWEEKKLKEVAKTEKIKNNKKDLPYIGMEDIESNSAKFLGTKERRTVKSSTFCFNSDHILYGRLRPYLNKIFLPDLKGHCSTEIFPIKAGDSLDKKFLFYWFVQNKTVKAINKTCTGTRMPRANMKEVFDFKISFPKSLTTQKQIVSKLNALSDKTKKLEKNYQRRIDDLEELKKAVLKKAFEGEL